MKVSKLYLLLLLGVLSLAGCASGETEAPAAEQGPAPAQATPPADTTAAASPAAADTSSEPVVLVLGNSIAAGYGLGPAQAFPALLQQKIDALGWEGRVVNAGLSGETTAGGLRRLDWLLRRPVDVLIVELGGNDGLRGLPPEVTRQNLQQIIDKARARYPDVRVILAGMQIPPSLGQDYAARFRAIYPALAEANDVRLIPFLLEGVGGVERLNQPDGIHPTAEGQRIIAENVWEVLRPVLQSMQPAT